MKYAPAVAGIILGLLFVMASVVFFFNLVEAPKPPDGTPVAMFFGAFGPTHYMTFVKVLELVGGILVMIPRTRNLGLLVLGPIIVNILAFTVFIVDPKELLNPMLIVIVFAALYLLWAERKAWSGLVRR
jgi:putative oxidoreductase